MRSLLSRLALWWAALAVGLSLVLPSPLGSWVAGLAAAAAALSLLIQRGEPPAPADPSRTPASPVEDAGLLETAASVVRCTAHSHDLPEALHGVARILFQELGADGLATGRIDDAGELLQLDRYADQASRCPAPRRETMSGIAAEAIGARCVTGRAEAGFAVPVTRGDRAVAWLEFSRLEMPVAAPSLMRLLDLVQQELSAVAERGAEHAPQESLTASMGCSHTSAATGDIHEAGAADVLDRIVLNRLRELDPSGANRLLERLVKAFESSTARLIPQLREGARVGDADGLRLDASALKSASASVGALALAQMCADIETRIPADDREDLGTRVETIAANVEIVLSVLRSVPAART